MNNELHLRGFTLGDWMTNCYVLWRGDGPNCWIVDAGFEPGTMIQTIREENLNPTLLILTHGHVDHIAGVNDLRDAWPELPIAIHDDERDFLTDPTLNLSAMVGLNITTPPADRALAHGETLDLDGLAFEIRHTPGHSPGGVTLYQHESQLALVGDALFADSIGRHDFPTSDGPTLLESIREQLYTLPDETRVFSGHGPETTIGHEKTNNPFVRP